VLAGLAEAPLDARDAHRPHGAAFLPPLGAGRQIALLAARAAVEADREPRVARQVLRRPDLVAHAFLRRRLRDDARRDDLLLLAGFEEEGLLRILDRLVDEDLEVLRRRRPLAQILR